MVLGGELVAVGWRQQAIAAGADLTGAVLLHLVAGQLQQSRERAAGTATAYFCACAAALLAGCSGVAACAQNLALLGALAAALAPGGVLLSPVLLAVGSADWLPGGVLLAAPMALLAARAAGGSRGGSGAGSRGGSLRLMMRPLAAYVACWAASVAALLQLQSMLAPAAAAQLDRWLGLAAWQAAVPQPAAGSSGAGALDWVGTRASQQAWHQRPARLLPAASLQPGLGLHWYLLAQSFPQFRAFFLYVLQALPAATMLPLALRFPHRPQLLAAAGGLLRCLLHPRPVPSMAALSLGLLPLAHEQLACVGGLGWHALAQAAALLMSDSAAQLWLGGRGGNANFLYGMNLVWGGLQVLLLLRLLRAAARAEATAAVGGGVVEGSGSAGKQRQD